MSSTGGLVVVLLSGVVFAQPGAADLDEAVSTLDFAAVRARRAGGRCRELLFERTLKQADQLDALRPPGKARDLAKAGAEVSELSSLAGVNRCPDEVQASLTQGGVLVESARLAWGPGRREGNEPWAALAGLEVVLNERANGEDAVRLHVPELTLVGLRGESFYFASRFRAVDGAWGPWVATQKWSVPADPFRWADPLNHLLRRSALAELDTSGGRFVARVSVFSGRGQELTFREVAFTATWSAQRGPAPAVVVAPTPAQPAATPGAVQPNNQSVAPFLIVDGGKGLIGLYSQERFVRMTDKAGADAGGPTPSKLPPSWSWERFRVVDGGNGLVALYNPTHRRFLRVNDRGQVDASDVRPRGDLPSDWSWERFQIVPVPGQAAALSPGAQVLLFSPVHQRYFFVSAAGTLETIAPSGAAPLPAVVPGVVAPPRDCGTGPDDPGCQDPRAMNKPVWQGFLAMIRAEFSVFQRQRLIESRLSNEYVTARQFGQVLEEIMSDHLKLEVTRNTASHVIDPQNALGLSSKFGSPFSRDDFVKLMGEQTRKLQR
ncbi:MAG: DUF4476 domain-containing protein [Myxococcus sp.]|nr:DUF4476 domain-containing protein [Myxococcus sp.]